MPDPTINITLTHLIVLKELLKVLDSNVELRRPIAYRDCKLGPTLILKGEKFTYTHINTNSYAVAHINIQTKTDTRANTRVLI